MDKVVFEERIQRLKNRTSQLTDGAVEKTDQTASHLRKLRRQKQRLLGLEMAKCAKKIHHQDDQKTIERIHQEKNNYKKICRESETD